MKMKLRLLFLTLIAVFALAACNSEKVDDTSKESEQNASQNETATNGKVTEEATEPETREITYLGESYIIPTHVERIVIAGSMESMEDALALGVEPVGAITVAGEFPEVYKSVMGNAESIGEKQEPNFEKILQLKPDVIVGTTKFPDEVKAKLEQIAPTIFVSHISSDWEDNLKLMGELGGTVSEADNLINEYKQNIDNAKSTIGEDFKGKTVLAMRVRGGKMFVYNEEFFFSPLLYQDLGLDVPDVIKQAKAQEEISVEQLAQVNPDYIYLQVQQTGNQENEKAFEELKKNPIVQNIKAFKEDQVYVNLVDSLLEGGPLFSRNEFVKALQAQH